ncbi:unnamed protein product [Ophioblennius macclurei]
MEFLGGGGGGGGGAGGQLAGGAQQLPPSGGSVPAFLTKLWTLVEDPDTDPLICWSPSGTSFHVFDQGRFSKEVLPKFFKHNNMASFIRQLNMYGFRKVVHIEQGGLVKPERDDTEFQHTFFIRGHEELLEKIKRKVTNVPAVRQEETKYTGEEINKILTDVQLMKGKQETIDFRIVAMKHENEALWREVAILRQKHAQQQKVVNKLLQFLVSLVQSNRILGVKRKIPLMLNDSSSAHSMPKYSRPLSLEHMQQAAASLFSSDSPPASGPIISDITELTVPPTDDVICDWTESRDGQTLDIKEEPSSPEAEVCPVLEGVATSGDTPLSPTTFINSILQDTESTLATPEASTAPPIIVQSPAPSRALPPASTNQSLPPATPSSTSAALPTPQKCQTVACIDKSELSCHVDSIDYGLENLQNVLNTQTFTFDTSPLLEFFGSAAPPADFDLDSLDSLLFEEPPRASDESSAGKQLVQYTTTSPSLAEGGVDLLEPLLAEDVATADADRSAAAALLLSHAQLESDL